MSGLKPESDRTKTPLTEREGDAQTGENAAQAPRSGGAYGQNAANAYGQNAGGTNGQNAANAERYNAMAEVISRHERAVNRIKKNK